MKIKWGMVASCALLMLLSLFIADPAIAAGVFQPASGDTSSAQLIVAGGDVVEHQSRVRLYTPRELSDLFHGVGFRNVHFFGDLRDEPLTLDSPRCIVLAERPV